MAERTTVGTRVRDAEPAEQAGGSAAIAPAAALVVALQRSAGNAAVTALISRDESATATASAPATAPAPLPDKTGIASRHGIGRYVAAAKKVQADWATLAKAEDRAKALGAAANEELKLAGVPAAKVRVKKLAVNGEFDFATWTLDIGKTAFEKATPSFGEVMSATDTVYHEARHAEQWFRIARLQAGKGWKAWKIATKLGIPVKIAKAAVANPLTGTGVDATEASSWFESVYGTGEKHREKTLGDLSKTRNCTEEGACCPREAEQESEGDPEAEGCGPEEGGRGHEEANGDVRRVPRAAGGGRRVGDRVRRRDRVHPLRPDLAVGNPDLVDALRQLSRLLSAPAPSSGDLEQRARETPFFTEVAVDDDDPPELVELELADSAELTVSELAGAFGEPSPLPRLPERPARVAFYVEESGSPASVALIASLDEDDEDRIRGVVLRRDERD